MRKPAAMIVAGVMSGTSADGVDVALVRVRPGGDGLPTVKVLGHAGFAYPKQVRAGVLRVMNGEEATAAEFSRLGWRLGAVHAECVEKACAAVGIGAAPAHDQARSARLVMGHPGLGLVGLHGQTVFHEGGRATWQMGEAAVLRERLGVPVVSDFRAADVAAGGQGAPLVPMVDFCLFRSAKVNRVLLNLGGIANFTVIPAGSGLGDVRAFDTGPANMVADGLMQAVFGKAFDRGGRVAARGRVIEEVVRACLNTAWFRKAPPKSCGREQFGAEYVREFHERVQAARGSDADAVASAVELTVRSIVDAYTHWGGCVGRTEVVAAGGGVQNTWLMQRLTEEFARLGVRVRTTAELGVEPQAKEAVAFAVLAWMSWFGMAGNVPGATGARRPRGSGEGNLLRAAHHCGVRLTAAAVGALLMLTTGCRTQREDPRTVVMAIESSPTNLDPRIGTDAQSERIGGLLFDALVTKDEHFAMRPWLALRWEQPDALTWVFHLRDGVRFTDGRPLDAEDVAWTINSLIDGSLLTSKSGAFASVSRVEATDQRTLTIHMKQPDASLLFNLSDGLFGVVPRGSGKDFGRHPVGSGPFKFVRAEQDKDVIVERNDAYWGGADGQGPAKLKRVRFEVVPDAVTAALELEKGSVDVASNQLTLDLVHALEGRPGLKVETGPGSPVMYMNFNVAHGPLADVRVRQAVACAVDRQSIVDAVWRGRARLAATLLPEGHWAAAPLRELWQCGHDAARARALLESAGFHADSTGVRLRLEMKTSTDDTTRLLALILQQQLREAGIALTLRPSEFGTFYADVTAERFEMYALRWIGSNEDPDIYRYAFGSDRVPPKGGNRGHYSNPRVDALLREAAQTIDERVRRRLYGEAERILAEEVPALPLWYPDNEVVHTTRIEGLVPRVDGSFGFLREARLR